MRLRRVVPSAPLCAQLLQMVVDKPNKSTCDMRFLSHIWEAFLRWCAENFENKVGIRVLGLGDFCYRQDKIGELEFHNPMFIMNESYAGSFGLHDRRPKNVQLAGDVPVVDLVRYDPWRQGRPHATRRSPGAWLARIFAPRVPRRARFTAATQRYFSG